MISEEKDSSEYIKMVRANSEFLHSVPFGGYTMRRRQNPMESILRPVEVNREQLYNDVWTLSAAGAARKYGVNYSRFLKTCADAQIPIMPSGYLVKVQHGKPIDKKPLPPSVGQTVILLCDIAAPLPDGTIAAVSNEHIKASEPMPSGTVTSTYSYGVATSSLRFLGETDQRAVISVACSIRLPEETERLHPSIIQYKKAAVKRKKEGESDTSWSVATRTLPRVYKIFDAIAKSTQPLNCRLTEQLAFIVRGETVRLDIHEIQETVPHELTIDEKRQLLKYEEELKKSSWAFKPRIAKYDHVYTGRLSISAKSGKSIRDGKSGKVEERLGELLIDMFVGAEAVRVERERRESEERARQEEARRREERRVRYNTEVKNTKSLMNRARDYETACQIRKYVNAVAVQEEVDGEIERWIKWANAKADWLDPTIARDDEYFGTRNHDEDAPQKEQKERYY